MTLRILDARAIEELASRVPFEEASRDRITTADIRPIDLACSSCLVAMASCAGLPAWTFSGELAHPPVPEEFRRFSPPAKWEAWSEPVSHSVRGVDVDGYRILLFESLGRRPGSRLWGLPDGASALVFGRGMPIETVAQVTPEALAAALALLEARALSDETSPGRPSDKSPRI